MELRAFGLACSRPAPWVHSLAHDDPHLAQMSLCLADKAIGLAANYIEIGQNYLDKKIDREELLKAIPDKSMSDGGTPLLALS